MRRRKDGLQLNPLFPCCSVSGAPTIPNPTWPGLWWKLPSLWRLYWKFQLDGREFGPGAPEGASR
jgi:hypothetical protein